MSDIESDTRLAACAMNAMRPIGYDLDLQAKEAELGDRLFSGKSVVVPAEALKVIEWVKRNSPINPALLGSERGREVLAKAAELRPSEDDGTARMVSMPQVLELYDLLAAYDKAVQP